MILSGILDAQTKVAVSKRGSHDIKIENANTATNTHSALLPLVRHYKGKLAKQETEVRMAGLLF